MYPRAGFRMYEMYCSFVLLGPEKKAGPVTSPERASAATARAGRSLDAWRIVLVLRWPLCVTSNQPTVSCRSRGKYTTRGWSKERHRGWQLHSLHWWWRQWLGPQLIIILELSLFRSHCRRERIQPKLYNFNDCNPPPRIIHSFCTAILIINNVIITNKPIVVKQLLVQSCTVSSMAIITITTTTIPKTTTKKQPFHQNYSNKSPKPKPILPRHNLVNNA